MNLDEIRKEKEAEREEVTRKIEAGQTFEEHIQEKSAFDLDDLRESHIIVHSNGEDIVLVPEPKKNND